MEFPKARGRSLECCVKEKLSGRQYIRSPSDATLCALGVHGKPVCEPWSQSGRGDL